MTTLDSYLFNVQFVADYFTLTVHVDVHDADEGLAVTKAIEIMNSYYGLPILNYAKQVEVEYC